MCVGFIWLYIIPVLHLRAAVLWEKLITVHLSEIS